MPQFAFLLPHAPDRYTRLTEDEAMSVFKDYMAWMEEATASGVCLGGQKLSSGPGKVVRRATGGELEVHDSPYAELAEVLGGLMFVRAADYDAAVEIARSHPHLVHNDKIEIRQIDSRDEG